MPVSMHKTLGVLYLDDDNVVQFGFKESVPSKKIGSEALLQKVVVLLFTDRGSNCYGDTFGGDLYKMIGKGYNPDSLDLIKNDFMTSFSNIEKQIKENQNTQPDLPLSEKLKKIELNSVEYNTDEHTWEIKATVRTELGTRLEFTVTS